MEELIEFLRARIAEELQIAVNAHGHWVDGVVTTEAGYLHLRHWDTNRVFVKIEAERRLLNELENTLDDSELAFFALRLLRLLGLAFADHPDYKAEWRP